MIWLLAALLLAGPTPEEVQARERLKDGTALLEKERYAEAAEAFREAIRLDPILLMAHYRLGQAHMAMKEYPAAVTAYRGARDAFAALVARQAVQHLENRDAREKRIQYLQDRIREMQDSPVQSGTSAASKREQVISQYELEIATLRRADQPQAVPETPYGISLALGSAHFRAGQMADAEREYRAAIAASPKLGEAHNNLAVVLLLTGRAAEASEHLQLAKKAGFKVPTGLEQDVEKALAKGPSSPRD